GRRRDVGGRRRRRGCLGSRRGGLRGSGALRRGGGGLGLAARPALGALAIAALLPLPALAIAPLAALLAPLAWGLADLALLEIHEGDGTRDDAHAALHELLRERVRAQQHDERRGGHGDLAPRLARGVAGA